MQRAKVATIIMIMVIMTTKITTTTTTTIKTITTRRLINNKLSNLEMNGQVFLVICSRIDGSFGA